MSCTSTVFLPQERLVLYIATIVLLLMEHSIEIIHFVCSRLELLAKGSEQFLFAFCQPLFYMMVWRMYVFGRKQNEAQSVRTESTHKGVN